MDREQVEVLEDEIGEAIAEVLGEQADRHQREERVIHLMAKAAVTVLEAFEAQQERR
jgi:hypothetical protein